MPCYDSRNDPSYVRAETQKESAQKINTLTDMLCRMCRGAENRGGRMPIDVQLWWELHKIDDAQRNSTKGK